MKTFMRPLPFAVLVVALALPWSVAAQQAFPTPEAAADAFVKALGAERADPAALATLLGKDWREFVPTEGVDRADVDAFLARYRERHAIEHRADGKAELSVGSDAWTLPLPLSKGGDGWRFDTRAAVEEIRIRRIGSNELAAADSVRAYHDAQMDYAEQDHDDDGVLEYAQKFISTDGYHDGLFWSDDDSGQISPLGPLFGDATPGGEWHGYHFRILDVQGASAPGGAYDYMLGDNMSRGFAVIAWPAKYGDSGVMSFMISHDGQVFEKDLGPQGEKLAKAMKAFDPDSSWSEVKADATAAR
ncbi:Protein of unknown function (DUF2950) [Luteimonas cucumeris]|uniref:DUF2950 family protein n=1 Tax=Luteimonas cucumeris TaxID=985012 RepID=A0A562KXT4_9GAMM|nr:DUF2950 domain-containing protein [Luteimonas cucumeris]TWI00004.1 Protein of unknown function (DUF2950) [Luteimonas cucumeris]